MSTLRRIRSRTNVCTTRALFGVYGCTCCLRVSKKNRAYIRTSKKHGIHTHHVHACRRACVPSISPGMSARTNVSHEAPGSCVTSRVTPQMCHNVTADKCVTARVTPKMRYKMSQEAPDSDTSFRRANMSDRMPITTVSFKGTHDMYGACAAYMSLAQRYVVKDMHLCGQRYVVKGMWSKVCGQRHAFMWSKVCGQRYVVKGMWSKVCGQRYVVKGMWSKVCGQRSNVHQDVTRQTPR